MKYYITNKNERYTEKTISFTEADNWEMKLIKVYPSQKKQEVLGFGGAFTEAAAYTFFKMSKDKQEELMEQYFGESGNKYNFCRTHIQSCDFSLGNYAYVDDPDDKELKSFSLERDKEYLVPFILKALEKNKEISFMASPWSPPPFMKDNGRMNRGGKLIEAYKKMWADMISKYLVEYKKMGIDIKRLTVQNEPNAVQTWDSCIFTAEEERAFVCDYLKPSLVENELGDIKVNVWDHNKDCIVERALESIPDEAADKAIDGIAFHWYSGDHFEALAAVRDIFPGKELIFTEGCVEYSRFKNADQVQNAEMYAHDMIGNFNGGTNGFIDWNMILDEKGGPNHVGNFCDAPVMCETSCNIIDTKLSFYYVGHFSRFVKKGARRVIVSRYTDELETVGFVNPDGEKVLVVLNRTDKPQEFQIVDGKNGCRIILDAHSIMTACW